MKDFFVSYTSADRSWAEWIAWRLEETGYSTIIQAWDFRPGENFVVEMQRAASEAERTILVLSEDYLKSSFALPEWAAAFAQDPTGAAGRIVPVRIKPCEPPGLLKAIIFIDLVGLGEEDARRRLLEGMEERAKPSAPPPFPPEARPPAFPGAATPGGIAVEPETPSAPSRPAPPEPREAKRSHPRRPLWRAAIAYLGASSVVFAASWMGLLSALDADDALERRFLAHMQRFLPAPDTGDLVLVSGAKSEALGEPGPEWRGYHAELIDALSRAGARMIVFDVDFADWSRHDAALARAIEDAARRKVPVVVGARDFGPYGEGKAWPRLATALTDLGGSLHWGTLSGDAKSARIELAQRLGPQAAHGRSWLESATFPVVPSLALQAVMQHEATLDKSRPARPVAAVFRPQAGAIEIRSEAGRPPLRIVPVVDSRLGFLVDVADRIPRRSYENVRAGLHEPKALAQFKDKIVVVGFEVPEDAWEAPGGRRYGMEIQASAIAQILNGGYLRRVRPSEELVVILLLGALGWLLRTELLAWTRHTLQLSLPLLGKPVEVPTAFLVTGALYLLVAFLACKELRIVPLFLYDAAALLLSYWAAGWAARGRVASPTGSLGAKAA